MKRRLIMLLIFLCVMYGKSWAIDVITNGNGLVKSENFVSNRASDGNVQEIWSGNAKMGFNFSQTTDLPNGVYTLSVQAMYRADKEKGTATNCVLFAETTGKVYNAPIANFGDCDNTTETLSGVANVMRSGASNYANSIPYIIVTDGRVNVGVRSLGALTYCSNGYWFIWDPSTFRLSEVTDTEVLEKALESIKSEALEILDNAQETDARAELQAAYDNAVATSEGIVALKEAVRAYYPRLATADNPIDVSFLMINPKYEEKALVVATNSTGGSAAYPLLQPAGWLCEDNVTAENAYHYFHVVGANETFDGNSNTAYDDGNTLYMRFAWNGAAPRISAKQTIRLPEGTYKLSVPARKNGNDITATVKYTFAGSEEVQTVTDWKAYEKMFTINNENKEITVELGFAREDVNVATQQAYFGGVTLWAYGDPLAAGRKSLQSEMDALKAYAGMVPSGLWASDGLYGKALAEAEELMVEASDAAELENMVVTLRGLSDEAEKMKPFYVSLNELIALCSECVEVDNSVVADEAVRTAFNVAIEAAKDICESAQKALELENACTALETARQDFVMSAEPVNGCVFDMTFTVQNADFSATGNWSETPALNYGVAEFYNKTFDMYQTITGLPNGEYQLSCQGFYRPGGTGDVMNNSDKMYVRLYANEASSPLMSIMGDAGKEGMTENGGTYIDGKLVPDNMASGATAFSAGLYNENVVRVVVANGTLTIGLKKETTIGSDWTLFDNFRLLKLNALAVDEVYGTIEAWKAKANALVDTKPLGSNENEALKDALAAAEDLSGKTTFELNQIVASLQKAVDAVGPWREAYETAKTPLVEAFERFERDFNDGENGALRPMSTEVWNTLLDAVKVASEAKDVTDSYAGFDSAAQTFNAALDNEAVKASIQLYSEYALMMSGLKGLGDAELLSVVQSVDNAGAYATDAALRASIDVMDRAFATYRDAQDGDFIVSALLGDNLDFETAGDAVVNKTGVPYSTVFDVPGWTNVFEANPTDGNMQYIHKEQTGDISSEAQTAHSLYMRAKWDTGMTTIQILKDAYLPGGNYSLSFFVKRTQSSALKDELCYYEMGGERKVIDGIGAAWERKTISFEVAEPALVTLSFGFSRESNTNDVDLFVDDITLTCHAQTAFARALAAAGNEENSLAAQSAYNEYKDAVEADMAEDVKVEAIEVLNNAVKIAQSGEVATLLIKNADFTGGTDNLPLKGSGGSVSKPKDWTFEYDYEGWNDTFVKTEDDVNIFNCWAGVIKRGELMQTLTALPNGVYRLSAELVSDVTDGSSWVALYGAPANGEIARAENVKEADAYGSYEVFFKVVDHHATIGVRSDAHYFKLRNIALEYVADNEENAVKTDNGRMLQYAYVNRNNAEVDLTGFGKANGATVYLTKKNALIKAVSMEQVANRKNVIVDGVCENLELIDQEPFAASEAFMATNALYTRSMTNEWGTLVLPYAVASNDRVKYYELTATRQDGDDSYMTFSLVDELPANTPCAFRRMDTEKQVNFEAVEVTIEPVMTKTVGTETGLTGWAADGYYEKVTLEEPEELGRTYYIANNTFMNATKSLQILPFRATFVNSEVNGVNRFLIDFSDWTNGMENVSLRASLSVFAETGMLRMVAGADVRYAVYTLSGMLVEQGMLKAGEEHQLKLASGIYIVNGLKVQVR